MQGKLLVVLVLISVVGCISPTGIFADATSLDSLKLLGRQRPPKDKRANSCLGNVVKFYNATVDFQETMLLRTKKEYFDEMELLSNDGAQLQETLNALEAKMVIAVQQVESWDGIRPNTNTITQELEQFALDMKTEHAAAMKKLKELKDRFVEATKTKILKALMLPLRSATEQFPELRQNYVECAPYLAAAGILLAEPLQNSDLIPFDFSAILELEKLYKEFGEIEDKMTPIIEKYGDTEDILPDSEDGQVIFEKLDRLAELIIEIQQMTSANDNMFRRFDGIVVEFVTRTFEEIDNVTETYDRLQDEISMNEVANFGSDARIMALIQKYNKLLVEANVAAARVTIDKSTLRSNDSKDEF